MCLLVDQLEIFWLLDMMEVYNIQKNPTLLCIFWYCFFAGNFITDIMLEISQADCALLNSGTFRSDRVHPKGWFKLRDLLTILPLVDELVVIEVTGTVRRFWVI